MTEEQLDRVFAALADRTRRAILRRLAGSGEATVNELAAPFDISLQAISRHLKVLEQAGLISRGRDAQFRPCRVELAPLTDAAGWLDAHRRMVAERMDRLGDLLNAESSTETSTESNPEADPRSDSAKSRIKETS